jgi:hypothetical protein
MHVCVPTATINSHATTKYNNACRISDAQLKRGARSYSLGQTLPNQLLFAKRQFSMQNLNIRLTDVALREKSRDVTLAAVVKVNLFFLGCRGLNIESAVLRARVNPFFKG